MCGNCPTRRGQFSNGCQQSQELPRGGAAHIGQVFLPERPRQPRPSVRPHRADPGIPIPRTSLPRECGNPALATDLPEGPTKAKFRILGPQSPSVAPLTEETDMRHTHLWHSTGMPVFTTIFKKLSNVSSQKYFFIY